MTILSEQCNVLDHGILKAKVNPTCNITVHGKDLELVQSFVYMGGALTSAAICERRLEEGSELQSPHSHQ